MLQLALWKQPYSCKCPFEGKHNAGMALSENEFDTPDLGSGGDNSHSIYQQQQATLSISYHRKQTSYHRKHRST